MLKWCKIQGENLLLGKGKTYPKENVPQKKMYPKRGIFDGSEECEIENNMDLVIDTSTNLPPRAHATHASNSTMAYARYVHATASPI